MSHEEDARVRCHRCLVMTYAEAIMLQYEGKDPRKWGYEDLVHHAGLILPCNVHARPTRTRKRRKP